MSFWRQIFCKHLDMCYKYDLDYEGAMLNRKLFKFQGLFCPACNLYKLLGIVTNRKLTDEEYKDFLNTGDLPEK